MDEDADAGGSDGGAIEIKGTVELGPGRQTRVQAGAAEQVQGEKGLRKEAIPEVKWKVLVGAAEAGDEMVLESTDCAFGGVAAMGVGRHKLKVNAFLCHELFEGT